jgi:hypothetical protein
MNAVLACKKLLNSLGLIKNIYVFSDSHGSVFHYINNKILCRYFFITQIVPGATAMGMVNPNSQTNALAVYLNAIKNIKNKTLPLLFLLGEVDTGFVIWYRANKYHLEVESQFNLSINNYFDFLRQIQDSGHTNISVVSAPLPTIDDGQTWGEVANLRSSVTATKTERTALTLRYNAHIAQRCKEYSFQYIGLDDVLLDKNTALIKREYLNSDPLDHHLDNKKYALLILQKLKQIRF